MGQRSFRKLVVEWLGLGSAVAMVLYVTLARHQPLDVQRFAVDAPVSVDPMSSEDPAPDRLAAINIAASDR